MRESDSVKPAIFAMSNPTKNGLFLLPYKICNCKVVLFDISAFLCSDTAECTAADAFKHAGENIVFASGSPFENVDLGILP